MCGQQNNEVNKLCELHDIKREFLNSYKGKQSKTKIIRNLVDYEVGKTIFQTLIDTKENKINQIGLFK